MIFLNMLSELNRFQFVKQLFVVHTYNEHRILPPKSGVWRQNGRDHSGHARFMSRFRESWCLCKLYEINLNFRSYHRSM